MSVRVNPEQAAGIAHLTALFGPGDVSYHEGFGFAVENRWLWFQTARQKWCVDHEGDIRGWNDVVVQGDEHEAPASTRKDRS
jgi:hypothetical protein